MKTPLFTRALISVSDKTHLTPLAKALAEHHIEILSTGGTAKHLQSQGITVTEISDYTSFPEIMDGRVKTLHPKVHGGLLGRHKIDDDIMAKHHINHIDLLVVNLYPFAATIKTPDCTLAQAQEQIDIGGPAMLRSGAKNINKVLTLVDPNDYAMIIQHLATHQSIDDTLRLEYAAKSFAHTAAYDTQIAYYLQKQLKNADNTSKTPAPLPETFIACYHKAQDLRYGENPHQRAAFYTETIVPPEISVASAKQHQGKPLSFNNLADTDAALECVRQFNAHPTCAIVKHANPCAVSSAPLLLASYERAYASDTVSAFGGIIAFNRELDEHTAQAIIDRQFVEVIIAPDITQAALDILSAKPNIRVLTTGVWNDILKPSLEIKQITGGILVQDRDIGLVNAADIKCVTERTPSEAEFNDLIFAWEVAKFVKSNAVVYVKDQQTIGIGVGQTSRVASAELGILKAQQAQLDTQGSVLASDAFFPFPDGVESAAKAGITAIIQPGGSIRDEAVIKMANDYRMAMVFTGLRHFRH